MFSLSARNHRRAPIVARAAHHPSRRHHPRRPPAAAVLLVSAVLAGGSGSRGDDTLEITYLANEGFLLSHGETRVLVDGLFGKGLDGYPVLAPDRRRDLEAGRPPFDGIDLVLASHSHGDHFDASAVARFLAANPEATFVSTQDAVDRLLKATDDPDVVRRAFGYLPPEGETVVHKTEGIDLTIFNLHHGRGRPDIQNLGLLVDLCGVGLLHVGDTEADADDFRAAGFSEVRPDVALLPSWLLRPSRWSDVAPQVLRPRQIVAMHLPTRDAPPSYFYGGTGNLEGLVATIRERYPEAWIPLATGDSHPVACADPTG